MGSAEDLDTANYALETALKQIRAPDHGDLDIVAAVLDWAGERGPNDDLTLLIVKKLPRAD